MSSIYAFLVLPENINKYLFQEEEYLVSYLQCFNIHFYLLFV